MILSLRNVSVYGEACDMRKSFNTLTAIVTETLGHDFLKGGLFLFVSRDRKPAKVSHFDGTGVCLFSKRLERGHFATRWRALCGVVVGRKNHYGSRSRRGTEVAALFYSLIESAKLAGIGPGTYLKAAVEAALRNDPATARTRVIAR